MFTGIIEGLGTIREIRPDGLDGRKIAVESDFSMEDTSVGDSIAVNGACLTATAIHGNRFTADISPETYRRTILKWVKPGARINLERALRLSDRIDGHLVSGHIDGIGRITGRKRMGNAIVISFHLPGELGRYIIPKGSIAIDGVSLTVNSCTAESFEVSIIPHTAGLTTVGFKTVGESVNIETDMIGKYVERLLTHPGAVHNDRPSAALDMAFLKQHGFA